MMHTSHDVCICHITHSVYIPTGTDMWSSSVIIPTYLASVLLLPLVPISLDFF